MYDQLAATLPGLCESFRLSERHVFITRHPKIFSKFQKNVTTFFLYELRFVIIISNKSTKANDLRSNIHLFMYTNLICIALIVFSASCHNLLFIAFFSSFI